MKVASALEGLTNICLEISLTSDVWTYATFENNLRNILKHFYKKRSGYEDITKMLRAFLASIGLKG